MAILDTYSNITAAWSMDRQLLASYGGAFYTVATGVSALNDQTGNARHLTQGTAANQPAVITTAGGLGRTAASFEGTNDLLTGTAISTLITNTTGYIVAVALPRVITTTGTASSNDSVFSDTGTNIGLHLGISSATTYAYAFNWSNATVIARVDSLPANLYAHVFEWKHESGSISCRVNGGSWVSTSGAGTNTNVTGLFRLATGGGVATDIAIFELVSFNVIPSVAQQDALVANMMARYCGGIGAAANKLTALAAYQQTSVTAFDAISVNKLSALAAYQQTAVTAFDAVSANKMSALAAYRRLPFYVLGDKLRVGSLAGYNLGAMPLNISSVDANTVSVDETINIYILEVGAPALHSQSAEPTGATTADLEVITTGVTGTIYWVATSDEDQPSGAQIISGVDHASATALDSGTIAVSSSGVKTDAATGLSSGSQNYIHFYQVAADAKVSNVVTAEVITPEEPAIYDYGTWSTVYKEPSLVLSGGDHTVSFSGTSANRGILCTSPILQKSYWELEINSASTIVTTGIALRGVRLDQISHDVYTAYLFNVNGSSPAPLNVTYTIGDRIGFAFDPDNGKLWVRKNGTWLGSDTTGAAAVAILNAMDRAFFPIAITTANFNLTIFTDPATFENAAPAGFSPLTDAPYPPYRWSTTDKAMLFALSDNQTKGTKSSTVHHNARFNNGMLEGKQVWAVMVAADGAGTTTKTVGVMDIDDNLAVAIGENGFSIGYQGSTGNIRRGLSTIATHSSWGAVGDVVMVATEAYPTNKIWFGLNGTWNGDPAAGTGSVGQWVAGGLYNWGFLACGMTDTGDALQLIDFPYPVPAGFTAPAVADPLEGYGDPYWDYVTFLAGFDASADAAATFSDEKLGSVAVFAGNAQMDTAQSLFGHASLLLDGTGDSIRFPNSTAYHFTNLPFTIEIAVRFNVYAGDQFLIAPWSGSAGALGWALSKSAANNLNWTVSTDGSNNFNEISYAWAASAGVWYRLCVDFDGTKYRMYVNGTMVGSSTTLRNIHSVNTPLGIGSNSVQTLWFANGWFDEVRLTKGICRYGSDSGYALATRRFPREGGSGAVSTSSHEITSTTLTADINSTTHTFTDVNFGNPHSSRTILILVSTESATAGHKLISGVIGGVTATIDGVQLEATRGISACSMYANVPAGSTGDVSLTFNTTADSVAISPRRLIGYYPIGSGGKWLFGTSGTGYIDTVTDGLVFAAVSCENETANISFTGLTEDSEGSIAGIKYAFATAAIAAGRVGATFSFALDIFERANMLLTAWTPIAPPAYSAGAWTPAQVGSMRLWYKIKDLVGSDGTGVATLVDASGWGNNATQVTPANQPTLEISEIDSKNVIRFNGANSQKMDLPTGVFDKWTSGSIFAVIKNVSDPAGAYIGAPLFTGSAGAQNHYPYTDGNVYDGNLTDTRLSTGDPSAALTTTHILRIESAPGLWRMIINGLQAGVPHYTTSTNNYSSGGSAPELGRGAGPYWDGWMCELLMFREVLPDTVASRVEGYLAHEWGAEGNLHASHPYKTAPP